MDSTQDNPAASVLTSTPGGLSEQVEQFEKSLIAAELTRPHSSLRSLAEALGLPRKTLHDKLRKHGLNFADSASHSTDDE